MTAKEYLTQAYRIDQRINSKLEQVSSLRDLSTKATSTLSDAPPSGTRKCFRCRMYWRAKPWNACVTAAPPVCARMQSVRLPSITADTESILGIRLAHGRNRPHGYAGLSEDSGMERKAGTGKESTSPTLH